MKKEIFRSYDIRGKLAEVSEEVGYAVGAGLVRKRGANTVLVGRDMRRTSPELLAAVIRGITEMGGNVVNIGLTNTSVWNFATTSLDDVDVGVMVTASHNPAEYNGIKVILRDGTSVSGTELFEIVQGLFEPVDASQKGSVEERHVMNAYLDAVRAGVDVPDVTGVKIALDYGNGMGAMSIQPLLEQLHVETIELFAEPDAHFPNHEANPADESTLVDVKNAVVENGAAFGVAFDGDLDRLRLVDERGESISSDALLALLAGEMLKDTPGRAVVVTVNMGWGVRDAIEAAGGKVVESPVGRAHIPAIARAHNAILGGEVSGHFTYEHFTYLESVDHTFLRVLNVWKRSQKTMSELVAPFQMYANSGEVNREVEDKDAVIQMILAAYKESATEVSELDGIKLTFGRDWWFSLRKSNTEPVVRLTLEATSQELMEEKREEILRMIET